MARLLDTVVEFGLGGSYFAKVAADSNGYRMVDWRMDMLKDVSTGGYVIPNRGQGLYGNTYIQGELVLKSGAGLVTDRLQRQVLGAIPDGWPGYRFTASAQEWALTDPFVLGVGAFVSVHAWYGEFHSFPASSDVALVDQPSAGSFEKGAGLWVNSAGEVHGHTFSGSIVNTAPLALDTKYFIVLTREGVSTKTWRLYVNGVEVDNATGVTDVVAASGNVLVGADDNASPTRFLDATVYHIGLYYPSGLSSTLTPIDATAVAAQWAALQWTDVSDDLLAEAETVVIERGFRSDDFQERVAAPAMCSISLDNTVLNAAGLAGYYSPGHANALAGFRRRMPVRVTVEALVQFRGWAETITPEPGSRGMRLTTVVATDVMGAAGVKLTGVPLLEDVPSDVMMEVVTSKLPVLPGGIQIYPGRDTYPVAFDNARDEVITVGGEWQRIHGSEFGLTYQRGDGTFVSEARGTRIQEHIVAALVVDPVSILDGIEVSDISRLAVTRVELITHARREGSAPEVLASAEKPIYVRGGLEGSPPVTVVLPYRSQTGQSLNQRVGGKDMIAPVAHTDWEAWHQVAPDGVSGQAFEQTDDVTVTAAFGPNSVEITIVNSHIFNTNIIGLQIRGTAIFDFAESVTIVEADAQTIQRDGVQPLTLDMKYQDDPEVARAVGRWLLASQVSPRARAVDFLPHVDLTSPDLLSLDISDRVTISEAQTGISGDYHIQGVRLSLGPGVAAALRWWLAPADPNAYWVLGVAGASELGVTTELYPA